MTETVPTDEMVEYEPVILNKPDQNEETGGVAGLVIDGITVRVDDIYFTEPEKEGDDVEMRIEYKLVDGIPDDIRVFEAKLAKVLVDITNEYASEKDA